MAGLQTYAETDPDSWLHDVAGQDPTLHFALTGEKGLIGTIGLYPGEDVHAHTAELGYWVGVPFWGRGIATAAVKAVTHYAFTRLGLVRVFAGVFHNNPASVRVLEKAGFTREAVLSKHIYKDGRYMDQWIYGRIRKDLA